MGQDTSNPPVGGSQGVDFLRLATARQDGCETSTGEKLLGLEDNIPLTLSKLGSLLSLMECIGACRWGCAGGPHVLEYQVARAVSFGLASYRLILFGHYDESLTLTRSIAEMGNLMMLFYLRPEEMQRWFDIPSKDRNKVFGPVKVRLKLEAIEIPPPTDEDHYKLLCNVGIHPTPETRPQAYNAISVPTMGGYPQRHAQTLCINELAHAIATVGGPAGKIAAIPHVRARSLVDATKELVESLGEVRIWSVTDSGEGRRFTAD